MRARHRPVRGLCRSRGHRLCDGSGRVAIIHASGWTFAWMVLLYGIRIALRGAILWRSLPARSLSLAMSSASASRPKP